MTRRIAWIALLVAAIVVLVGSWLATRLERVSVEAWTPPGKAAQRNPHLALERFLAAMGRPLSRPAGAGFLDTLPAGGVIILDNHRRAQLSPARLERLLAWVERGGYLVAVPEAPGIEDPLLASFQVGCGCRAEDSGKPANPKAPKPSPPAKLAVAIPGAPRPLDIDFPEGRLTSGERAPDWRAGPPDYPSQVLHFRHGAGHVTLIPAFSRLLDNRHIGHRDHAEFLWTLIETYQPDRGQPVTLLTRLPAASLWQWLAESAWTAVVSAALLVALWLWRAVPRFGPIRPEPEAGRRELGEHLAAVGRHVWRSGGLEHWLETAREAFRTRLALHHPGLLALPPAEQAAALAELTGRPLNLIHAALFQPAASPQSFTQALRTLRNLERTF